MTTLISVVSPHPAYHIFAQYNAAAARWVYRVFGPAAGAFGTFANTAEAYAFVRESAAVLELPLKD